jgi:uncharacterized protein with FMN-binding domain
VIATTKKAKVKKAKVKKARLKRVASLAFFIMVGMQLISGCTKQVEQYVPGTYYNEQEGYYSTLKVSVVVDAYRIKEIQVISHEEPEILAEIVFDKLPRKMIKANSTEVDVVSGATYTSRALLDAVAEALEQARVVKE